MVCQEGYRDEGDSYITCQSDGHWSTYNQCRIIGTTEFLTIRQVAVFLFIYSVGIILYVMFALKECTLCCVKSRGQTYAQVNLDICV